MSAKSSFNSHSISMQILCLLILHEISTEDVLNDPKGECVICLEDLNAGDVIARLPCLCIYHKGWVISIFFTNQMESYLMFEEDFF